MQELFNQILPSLKFKVLLYQYRSVLENVKFFEGNAKVIDHLVNRIEVSFFQPEMTIVRQFDTHDKNMYFTGAGICNIVRQFDSKTTREMDVLKEGQMVGEN